MICFCYVGTHTNQQSCPSNNFKPAMRVLLLLFPPFYLYTSKSSIKISEFKAAASVQVQQHLWCFFCRGNSKSSCFCLLVWKWLKLSRAWVVKLIYAKNVMKWRRIGKSLFVGEPKERILAVFCLDNENIASCSWTFKLVALPLSGPQLCIFSTPAWSVNELVIF